jgi:hypothetical protein
MHRFLILLGLLLAVHGGVVQVQAQDLIEMYQTAHLEAQAAEMARTFGMRLEPLAPERVPAPHDSLFVTEQAHVEMVAAVEEVEEVNPFADAEWRVIRRFRRGSFERDFADTRWAYLGSAELSPLDTTMTRELRAHLQAKFGRPTRTIIELMGDKGRRIDEYLQFEYWFVVNDSIPVLAMDTAGPFDRGLVLASDDHYRPMLDDLRAALGALLMKEEKPDVYSDYYYDPEQRTWYLTGYDGRRYYTQRVTQPDFTRLNSSLADQ